VGALRQYWLYSRCAKRGASDAWVRGGKERALMQMKGTLRDLLGLLVALLAAGCTALFLWCLSEAAR